MAEINLLSDRKVTSAKAGFHADGGNLYLRVTETGSKSWVFRYQSEGKVKQLGLGATKARTLKAAREVAAKMRAALANGDDPALVLKPKFDPDAMTFKRYAEAYIEHLRTARLKGKPRNTKAVEQWPSTLAKWVYPKLGAMRPSAITYGDVRATLTQAGLAALPETQKRVRQRIKVILDEAAKEEGEPHRYNPALSFKLEKRDPASIKNHAAAPFAEVPTIMAALRAKDSTSALLLRFSILTAARSGEARGALWAEIDLEGATWAIPASRMKAGRPHRVPLSDEALAVLKVMAGRKHPDTDRVFPGALGGLISDVAINKTLHGIMAGVTAHGFRSSFRQWGAEKTNFSREALELALAHTNPNKVEGVYQRSDLFEVRKPIMKAWAEYCAGKDNVIKLVPSSGAA